MPKDSFVTVWCYSQRKLKLSCNVFHDEYVPGLCYCLYRLYHFADPFSPFQNELQKHMKEALIVIKDPSKMAKPVYPIPYAL